MAPSDIVMLRTFKDVSRIRSAQALTEGRNVIEPGQLRRWKEDFNGDIFLVVRHMGKFYPQGGRAGDPLEDHWQIMMEETIHSGWSSSLLEELSEAVHGAP